MCFSGISPCQFILISTVVALIISTDKDAIELLVIGSFFVGVGSLLLLAAAQKGYLEVEIKESETREDLRKQIIDLQEKFAKL